MSATYCPCPVRNRRSSLRLTGCPIPKRISPPRSVADWQLTTRPPLFRAARNSTIFIYPYWLQSGVPETAGGTGAEDRAEGTSREGPLWVELSYRTPWVRSAVGRVRVN